MVLKFSVVFLSFYRDATVRVHFSHTVLPSIFHCFWLQAKWRSSPVSFFHNCVGKNLVFRLWKRKLNPERKMGGGGRLLCCCLDCSGPCHLIREGVGINDLELVGSNIYCRNETLLLRHQEFTNFYVLIINWKGWEWNRQHYRSISKERRRRKRERERDSIIRTIERAIMRRDDNKRRQDEHKSASSQSTTCSGTILFSHLLFGFFFLCRIH